MAGRPATAQAPDAEEMAISQLRKAATFRSSGLHHALLLALRDLRDPAMKPFFQSLVQADHWTIQLDAILGLAELGGENHVDAFLLGRLREERDRADAVRIALEMGMLDRDQIEKILAWDDLPSLARVVLLAELRRLGGTPDPALLQRLVTNPDPAIAGLAACIAAQCAAPAAAPAGEASPDASKAAPDSKGAAPLEQFAQTLRQLQPADRDGVIEEIANAARRYDLPVAIDLLSFRVTGEDEDPGPQESVVGMALALEPKRGLALWKKMLGRSPSYADRVRDGLILLLSAKRLPPEAFDAIVQEKPAEKAGGKAGAKTEANTATNPDGKTDGAAAVKPSDDPLLKAMVAAGKAVATGRDTAAALAHLYDVGNRRCCRWVLAAAEDLDAAGASSVYEHVIAQVDDPKQRTPDRRNDAIDAAARLIERDPDALKRLLAAAEDDGPTQEAILLGLANTRSPDAGDAAATVRRIGAGRNDSLALLIMARHRAELAPDDLRLLGLIAGGGGGVDETLRAQAAWLYLKRSGKLESALAKVVGSS